MRRHNVPFFLANQQLCFRVCTESMKERILENPTSPSNVVSLAAYRLQKFPCSLTPGSIECTVRLRGNDCPGSASGKCVSPAFVPMLHNEQLPLFFAAQC